MRNCGVAIVFPIIITAGLAAIATPQFAAYRERGYIAKIKTELKNAADAQKSYFAKNNSHKSCVACTSRDLPGFRNTSKVTLNAEVGRTNFVLVAHMKNAAANGLTRELLEKSLALALTTLPMGGGFYLVLPSPFY